MKIAATVSGGLGRDFAGTFATSIARLIFSGITSILLARMLGPQARGEFALILLWSGIFGTVAMVGTNEAVSYYASADPANANRHLRSALRLCVRFLAVTIPIAMLLIPYLLRSATDTARTLAVILIPLYLPLTVLYYLTQGYLQGQRRFRSLNGLLVMNDSAYCVIAVTAFLSRNLATPLLLALGAFAASSVATAGIAVWILTRSDQIAASVEPSSSVGSDMVASYGRSVAPANWIMLLSSRLDEMVCSQVLPVGDMGIYSVAKTTIVGLNVVPIAFSMVLLPRVVAAHRSGNLPLLMKRSALFAAACLASVLIPSLLLMPYLLPLVFGKQFAAGVTTARLLLTAAAFAGMTEVAVTTLKGTNQLRLALACRVAVVALLFGMLLILARPMGLPGVALACIVASVAGSIGSWVVVARTAGRARAVPEYRAVEEVIPA